MTEPDRSTLLRALWTFNFIDLLWMMTRGGPAGATTTAFAISGSVT